MLCIFSTFDNMLKLTISPQAKRAETDPRQGTLNDTSTSMLLRVRVHACLSRLRVCMSVCLYSRIRAILHLLRCLRFIHLPSQASGIVRALSRYTSMWMCRVSVYVTCKHVSSNNHVRGCVQTCVRMRDVRARVICAYTIASRSRLALDHSMQS